MDSNQEINLTKVCSRCKRELSLSNFFNRKDSKDGHVGVCKECKHEEYVKKYVPYTSYVSLDIRNRRINNEGKEEKLCRSCNTWQPIDNFYKLKTDDNTKRSNLCICCEKLYKEQHREEKLAYAKKYNFEHREDKKLYREQHKEQYKEYIKTYKTKPENIERKRLWSIEYRKKTVDKQKEYYQQHRDKLLEQAKKYRLDNLEVVKQRDKLRYNRNKLARCFSVAIYQSLKENKQDRHWEDLVSYTLDELKQHLESQFTSEMNWNNYGSYWEVDHIIPQNLFKFTSNKDREFKICWSLANLRPLEKSLNRSRPKDGSDISNEIKEKIQGQIF